MDKARLKRRYLVLVIVTTLVAGYILNERRFVGDKPEMTGIVTAIEDAAPNELGFKKVAVVRLADGSSLRANVLPPCQISPGQLAHLVGGRSSYVGRSYVVMAAEDLK